MWPPQRYNGDMALQCYNSNTVPSAFRGDVTNDHGFGARDSKLVEAIAEPFPHQITQKKVPLDRIFKLYKLDTLDHKKTRVNPQNALTVPQCHDCSTVPQHYDSDMGFGGVKRCKRLHRPPRGAQYRIYVRGGRGRVAVKGIVPRASAVRSGRGNGVGGSQVVGNGRARFGAARNLV
ncbi:hypothetical protein EDB84DRAFT_1436399 [Lactarius hengduanensis]|nr:hypothetical protein EDB84DRAFT_1436399 [Lactarius hengduanensis]